MSDPKIGAYMTMVVGSIGHGHAEVEHALSLIAKYVTRPKDAQALQLLALRRYLRMGGKRVHAQWAWTAEQAAQYSNTGQGKLLTDEAAKVQRAFAAANPGYSLAISPLRNLERQVRLWDANNTVQTAAHHLMKSMMEILAGDDYPKAPTGTMVAQFRESLRAATVTPEPSSAAPGTSDHGQMRAVDLVVVKGSTTVAGTETARIESVWKAQGWEAKLIAATAGTMLVGPLKHPYEPWHWRLGR
jgi:D-alanyl-D-alanine carboxypeptidase